MQIWEEMIGPYVRSPLLYTGQKVDLSDCTFIDFSLWRISEKDGDDDE